MFGIQFVKFAPNDYVLKIRNGRVSREGEGLSFFYYAPVTSLVVVPVQSVDAPFIFTETSGDFQELTIQGQVTYRIADPKKIAKYLNYAVDTRTHRYISDDPEKLGQRLTNTVQVLTQGMVRRMGLREALTAGPAIVEHLIAQISREKEIALLGLEILGVAIIAIKPTPETGKALEAGTREQILLEADEAIYKRRNSAIENERKIKENELNTQIAIEEKNRQVRESQMEAEKAVQLKQQEINDRQMEFDITQEEKNRRLTGLRAQNQKAEADARAYGVGVLLKNFSDLDEPTLRILAQAGMDPAQLIAGAFRSLADNADKIGNLNVSPELLNELLRSSGNSR